MVFVIKLMVCKVMLEKPNLHRAQIDLRYQSQMESSEVFLGA